MGKSKSENITPLQEGDSEHKLDDTKSKSRTTSGQVESKNESDDLLMQNTSADGVDGEMYNLFKKTLIDSLGRDAESADEAAAVREHIAKEFAAEDFGCNEESYSKVSDWSSKLANIDNEDLYKELRKNVSWWRRALSYIAPETMLGIKPMAVSSDVAVVRTHAKLGFMHNIRERMRVVLRPVVMLSHRVRNAFVSSDKKRAGPLYRHFRLVANKKNLLQSRFGPDKGEFFHGYGFKPVEANARSAIYLSAAPAVQLRVEKYKKNPDAELLLAISSYLQGFGQKSDGKIVSKRSADAGNSKDMSEFNDKHYNFAKGERVFNEENLGEVQRCLAEELDSALNSLHDGSADVSDLDAGLVSILSAELSRVQMAHKPCKWETFSALLDNAIRDMVAHPNAQHHDNNQLHEAVVDYFAQQEKSTPENLSPEKLQSFLSKPKQVAKFKEFMKGCFEELDVHSQEIAKKNKKDKTSESDEHLHHKMHDAILKTLRPIYLRLNDEQIVNLHSGDWEPKPFPGFDCGSLHQFYSKNRLRNDLQQAVEMVSAYPEDKFLQKKGLTRNVFEFCKRKDMDLGNLQFTEADMNELYGEHMYYYDDIAGIKHANPSHVNDAAKNVLLEHMASRYTDLDKKGVQKVQRIAALTDVSRSTLVGHCLMSCQDFLTSDKKQRSELPGYAGLKQDEYSDPMARFAKFFYHMVRDAPAGDREIQVNHIDYYDENVRQVMTLDRPVTLWDEEKKKLVVLRPDHSLNKNQAYVSDRKGALAQVAVNSHRSDAKDFWKDGSIATMVKEFTVEEYDLGDDDAPVKDVTDVLLLRSPSKVSRVSYGGVLNYHDYKKDDYTPEQLQPVADLEAKMFAANAINSIFTYACYSANCKAGINRSTSSLMYSVATEIILSMWHKFSEDVDNKHRDRADLAKDFARQVSENDKFLEKIIMGAALYVSGNTNGSQFTQMPNLKIRLKGFCELFAEKEMGVSKGKKHQKERKKEHKKSSPSESSKEDHGSKGKTKLNAADDSPKEASEEMDEHDGMGEHNFALDKVLHATESLAETMKLVEDTAVDEDDEKADDEHGSKKPSTEGVAIKAIDGKENVEDLQKAEQQAKSKNKGESRS